MQPTTLPDGSMIQYGRDDVDYHTWYTPYMRQMARLYTETELLRRLGGTSTEASSAAAQHERAIAASGSAIGQSQRRAQTRNATAAAGDEAIAIRGALEIHQLFPEHARSHP